MYKLFIYIIENKNGDVVVFDSKDVVVVIDCGGKYCFMYIRFLLGLKRLLCGVCIDFLLYILVVDVIIKIVIMINYDG